jgi:hypothetical protein
MIAKPRPKLLERREARAKVNAEDRAENAKVKQRSYGRCEVKEVGAWGGLPVRRCSLRASQVHHLISGIGRRNVGKSIKAEHKLHVCDRCHEEIHGHVLKPVNDYERESAATVRYERVR